MTASLPHGTIKGMRSFRTFVSVAALASAFFWTGALAAPPASSPTHRENTDKSLPNFAAVDTGILRGAAPTTEGLRRLKAMGVRTIIDLRIERKGQAEEEKTARELGIQRIRIPLGREAPTRKQVETFLSTLNDPAKRPVFIHCQWGADRTGAMVGIWRETHDSWDFPRTYAEMRHYGFKPYLKELKGAVEQRAPRSAR